jgi:Holliday junction resolvase
MSTPEGQVKKKLVAILKRMGAYYFFPATHGYGRSGVPDVVGCFDGNFFAIECKAESKKPTALQLREMEQIALNGGAVFVYDGTMEDAEVAQRIMQGGVK